MYYLGHILKSHLLLQMTYTPPLPLTFQMPTPQVTLSGKFDLTLRLTEVDNQNLEREIGCVNVQFCIGYVLGQMYRLRDFYCWLKKDFVKACLRKNICATSIAVFVIQTETPQGNYLSKTVNASKSGNYFAFINTCRGTSPLSVGCFLFKQWLVCSFFYLHHFCINIS